jgi:hypothetical protein
MNEKVRFHLNRQQAKKIIKGTGFSVSAKHMHEPGTAKISDHYVAECTPAFCKKLRKCHTTGKGLRVNVVKDIVGGSLFGDIGNFAMHGLGGGFWDDLKSGASKAVDFVKRNAGDAVEIAKTIVPEDTVKNGLKGLGTAGLTGLAAATGQPELLALAPGLNGLIDKGVSKAYEHDFSKPLNRGNVTLDDFRPEINSIGNTAATVAKDKVAQNLPQVIDQTSTYLPQAAQRQYLLNRDLIHTHALEHVNSFHLPHEPTNAIHHVYKAIKKHTRRHRGGAINPILDASIHHGGVYSPSPLPNFNHHTNGGGMGGSFK